MYTPPGSTEYIVSERTRDTIGELVNYSVKQTAIPTDPRDSSTQVPSVSMTVANAREPARNYMNDSVILQDWSGTSTTAKVVAVGASSSSGIAQFDTVTLFDRLNTEQTTYPIIRSDTGYAQMSATTSALEQWCLMCGVPRWRTPGNLLHSIPYNGQDVVGLIANAPTEWRYSGPPNAGLDSFTPNFGTYAPNIEVNPAQGIIMGAMFQYDRTLSEFRIQGRLTSSQQDVIYTVRRNGNVYTVREKVGSAAEVVRLTATHTLTSNYVFRVDVLVKANATDGKVDITLRILEPGAQRIGGASEDYYTDYTATAVTSTLRNRPMPFKIDLGYADALVIPGGHTSYGPPEAYFLSEGIVLPETFPVEQVYISGMYLFNVAGYSDYVNYPSKIPGFTDNVWNRMREFCSIIEMDIAFAEDQIQFIPRQNSVVDSSNKAIPAGQYSKSAVSESFSNRETARSVEVIYRPFVSEENNYSNTLLWKADTVYSLNKAEYREEVVQTKSTFLYLNQPVPVAGVPVPYTSAFGSYVITGNDGFIVDPQWWKDNGGSIKVEPTGKAGEIKIMLQAPAVDSVRAPYRLSEGVADRPALYILGNGLRLDQEKTVKIFTGAGDAAQDVGVTFDSAFVTNLDMAYNTGYKLARVFGTDVNSASFGINKATRAIVDMANVYGPEYSPVPINSYTYWNGSNYRLNNLTLTPQQVSVESAERFNAIAHVTESFGAGATIADWNAAHAGKSVGETNLAPLKNYIG